jgi:hypothetical protein
LPIPLASSIALSLTPTTYPSRSRNVEHPLSGVVHGEGFDDFGVLGDQLVSGFELSSELIESSRQRPGDDCGHDLADSCWIRWGAFPVGEQQVPGSDAAAEGYEQQSHQDGGQDRAAATITVKGRVAR